MKAKLKQCQYCGEAVSRDALGLCKKLFVRESKQSLFSCLPCIADRLECTIEDLEEKIEDFRREGCKLFS